jgi:hypothetical protein
MPQNIYWISGAHPYRLAIVARPRGHDWLADETCRQKHRRTKRQRRDQRLGHGGVPRMRGGTVVKATTKIPAP